MSIYLDDLEEKELEELVEAANQTINYLIELKDSFWHRITQGDSGNSGPLILELNQIEALIMRLDSAKDALDFSDEHS
jgi:hypothetical protein